MPYCKPTPGCGPARRAPDEPPQDAMAIELPPLPYERSALEPHISAETVDFHYGKHKRAYVDRLNELVADTPFAEAALEDIVRGRLGAMYNHAEGRKRVVAGRGGSVGVEVGGGR